MNKLKNPLMTDIECKRLYYKIINKLKHDNFILNSNDVYVINKLRECEKSLGYMSMFNDLIRIVDTQEQEEQEEQEQEQTFFELETEQSGSD